MTGVASGRYGPGMDDFELTDGTSMRPFPPDAFDTRRLAAWDAAADAGIGFTLMVRPPREIEKRIAQELQQDIKVTEDAWYRPEAPGEDRPQLLRRLQSLIHFDQLIRALLDTDAGGDVDPGMKHALEAAAAMCAGFEAPLAELEDYLQQHSATHPDRLPELEQQRHPVGLPNSLWNTSHHALTALHVLESKLLKQILNHRPNR